MTLDPGMSELVEFWCFAQIVFPAGFTCQGGIIKDSTVWLNGARQSPNYVFKNNISLTNSKI